MTAITIARPTIVRTSPPPAEGPAACEASTLGCFRSSGVDSPSAANAAGASRRQLKAAAPAEEMAAGSLITEGRLWIGVDPVFGRDLRVFSQARAVLEAQLVDH